MEAALTLDYDTRVLLSWGSAMLGAIVGRFALKLPWHKTLGFALMTVPLWMTGWGYINNIQRLVDSGSVLRTYSTWLLSSLWTRGTVIDLGYIGAGFLVHSSGGTWRGLWRLDARNLARKAADAGLPMGQRGEWPSVAVALLAFPVFLIGTWIVNALVYSAPALVNGDEASVWNNMTPYHAIWLSLSAGFGEELLYRGVLMVALMRIMPTWAAVGLQALLFGFAHAGYGTFAHVIVPTLFGLLAGIVAVRYGIWAAIVFHVLIDVVAFGQYAANNAGWFYTLLVGALVVNAVWSAGWGARWTYQKFLRSPVQPT